MPTTATMSGNAATAAANQGGSGAASQAAVAPVIPFVRASYQNRQSSGISPVRPLSGALQDLGVNDIPAYGYLRSLVLTVTAVGAVGTPVFSENGPWNALQNVFLTEPNGAIISQFNDGFHLYLANKWGGYRLAGAADPKAAPSYSQDAAGNFTFTLRIPVEINPRDALGALPNQNSAAAFKLRLALAPTTQIYTTAPTTLPTVTVSVYMESWDQPALDAAGASNQVTPPAMNTTQFWTPQVLNVSAGLQTLRLNRLGNWMRNLIFIFQNAAGSRSAADAQFPDPLTLLLDVRPMDALPRTLWKEQMFQRAALTPGVAAEGANGLNNGVYVYDFTHDFDGGYGHELRNLWLGTLGSERLELQGNFGVAGTLTVLTNDVTIAGNVWS